MDITCRNHSNRHHCHFGCSCGHSAFNFKTGSGGPSNAYLNQNYFAYDAASNRTAVQQNSVNRVKLGGTVTTGDTLTITVKDTNLPGGQEAVNYTVVGGDTLATIATNFAAAITANANLLALGVNAAANTSADSVISIKSASPNITTYAQSTSGGATETISLGTTNNFVENAVIGGIKTTDNVLTITVLDPALSGGSTAINYTVLAADTLITIATGLKTAINANAGLTAAGISATSVGTAITIKSNSANANLTAIGVTASASSTVLNLKSTSINNTTYTKTLSGGATETITLAPAASASDERQLDLVLGDD